MLIELYNHSSTLFLALWEAIVNWRASRYLLPYAACPDISKCLALPKHCIFKTVPVYLRSASQPIIVLYDKLRIDYSSVHEHVHKYISTRIVTPDPHPCKRCPITIKLRYYILPSPPSHAIKPGYMSKSIIITFSLSITRPKPIRYAHYTYSKRAILRSNFKSFKCQLPP